MVDLLEEVFVLEMEVLLQVLDLSVGALQVLFGLLAQVGLPGEQICGPVCLRHFLQSRRIGTGVARHGDVGVDGHGADDPSPAPDGGGRDAEGDLLAGSAVSCQQHLGHLLALEGPREGSFLFAKGKPAVRPAQAERLASLSEALLQLLEGGNAEHPEGGGIAAGDPVAGDDADAIRGGVEDRIHLQPLQEHFENMRGDRPFPFPMDRIEFQSRAGSLGEAQCVRFRKY